MLVGERAIENSSGRTVEIIDKEYEGGCGDDQCCPSYCYYWFRWEDTGTEERMMDWWFEDDFTGV